MTDRQHRKSFGNSRLVDHIERVDLRVRDLDRSIDFYSHVVGLNILDRTGERVVLGAGDGPAILTLDSSGVKKPANSDATGLFHVAIRYPNQAALGDALARLSDAGYRIGASDHLVSEALYVDDPDGNGVELYRDRPADEWPAGDGDILVPMPSKQLDLESVYDAGDGHEAIGTESPAGTDIGHVHLQVSDLETTANFFEKLLGMDRTMAIGDSARFYSSNGYHHHIGANVWHSRDGEPAPADTAGLEEVVFAAEDRGELTELQERLDDHQYPFDTPDDELAVADPDDNEFRFVVK